MRKLLLLLTGVVLFAVQALAQQRTITGKVTDDKGNSVADASVVVKGTSLGTTSKGDGSFTLSVPNTGNILVISQVGFQNYELKLGSQTSYLVSLVVAEQKLEEVVVVAYGTQKKSSLTGSVSGLKSDDLLDRPVSNVAQALAGAAPGISATSGNGQPGSSPGIRIRGFGSINASSEPLYVVDGFPYGGLKMRHLQHFTGQGLPMA
jgi:outer membrane receptor protein involved in Fe transport